MRKWPARLGVIVAAVGLLAPAADAAMVTDIRGDVLVNRGVGFTPVKEPVELAPGDLVLVGANGSARVDFGKGCDIVVRPNEIVRVTTVAPCQSAAGPLQAPNSPSVPPSGGVSTSTLVIGGLAVAGGAGLALGLAGGGGGGGGAGQSRPASP